MMKINRNPEYFLTVAAEHSISKAAEKLYVSQPYLSQHIIRLEDSLNMKLLDRDKTPLELTLAGEIYANYLESSRQLYQKLMLDFDAISADRSQTLKLGFSNWRASTLLPDVLPAFTARYPDVKLEFFEEPHGSLYRLVADDKVDFAIMNTVHNTPDYVTTETIMHEKILLVGHRGNPTTQLLLQMQREGQPVDPQLLQDERIILLKPESALTGRVNNWLDKKCAVLRNFVYTDSAVTALNLTVRNYGFCFLNETGAWCAPNRHELAFFDLDTEDMMHPLCVVYKKKSYLRPVAKEFISMTIEFYKDKTRSAR